MQNVIDKIELTFAALDGFLGWFFGAMSRCSESAITHRFTPTRMSVPQRQNRSRENKWKALCGNYVGGVLGVPHGLLSGGVLLIKMFDKL